MELLVGIFNVVRLKGSLDCSSFQLLLDYVSKVQSNDAPHSCGGAGAPMCAASQSGPFLREDPLSSGLDAVLTHLHNTSSFSRSQEGCD